MSRAVIDDKENQMRRIAGTLNGRPSMEMLPPGAPTCLTCKGPPSMSFWRGSKFWTVGCKNCPGGEVSGAFDTHAAAITAWSRRNERAR